HDAHGGEDREPVDHHAHMAPPIAISPTATKSANTSPPLPRKYPPTTCEAAMASAQSTTREGERSPPATAAARPRNATTIPPPAAIGKWPTPSSTAAAASAPATAKVTVRTICVSTPISSAASGDAAVSRNAA